MKGSLAPTLVRTSTLGGFRSRRLLRLGLTIIDLLVALSAMIVLLSLVLPVLAGTRGGSGVMRSLANLQAINTSLASYAADFNGRQPTAVVDDFSTYGVNGMAAVTNYAADHPGGHPPLLLGFCDGGEWGYYLPGNGGPAGNYVAIVPMRMEFPSSNSFGFFRITNAKMMQDYLGGRWFDPTFYAPNDAAAYSICEPWFDLTGCAFPGLEIGNDVPWSSYCFSPAAMFDPQVLSLNVVSGQHYKNPYSYAKGFRSPHVSQAKYPDLKTRVIEHSWNQNTPQARCNPAFAGGTYAECEPYYFNHGAASEPATLFFDGSTRLLPNQEVEAADEQLLKDGGPGVWSRDTPLGPFGYYNDVAYDSTNLSHHILTVDGILGRDTLRP
jgi:hypothetical protein